MNDNDEATIKRVIERLRGVADTLERHEATRREARRLAEDIRVALSHLERVFVARTSVGGHTAVHVAEVPADEEPGENGEDVGEDEEDGDEEADEDPVPEEKRTILLTMAEAAEEMGVGRTKVQQMVLRGELASLTIGRARRIPVWVVDAYVAAHPRPTDG